MINSVLNNVYYKVINGLIYYIFDTSMGIYKVHYLGFEKADHINIEDYEVVDDNDKIGLKIQVVASDGELLIIKFSDGSFMEYGSLSIDSEGIVSNGFKFSNEERFEELDGFLNDGTMVKLTEENNLYIF